MDSLTQAKIYLNSLNMRLACRVLTILRVQGSPRLCGLLLMNGVMFLGKWPFAYLNKVSICDGHFEHIVFYSWSLLSKRHRFDIFICFQWINCHNRSKVCVCHAVSLPRILLVRKLLNALCRIRVFHCEMWFCSQEPLPGIPEAPRTLPKSPGGFQSLSWSLPGPPGAYAQGWHWDYD